MWTIQEKKFMRRAITLARKALGRTAPNPAVGAIVVRNGRIVGEGYHHRAGTPHAEIHALTDAGKLARGAELYVTLEPCNHTGRTPPCTHAILGAGISKVTVGTVDPNPAVAGSGLGCLMNSGVEVRTGCLQDECRLLIAPFVKHILTGRPWVRSKVACSLDGRIATRTGHSKWVTNDRARSYGHRLRMTNDAILVGKGTLLADNPRLTCRKGPGRKENLDPARIILDSGLNADPDLRIFHLDSPAPTLVIASEPVSAYRIRELESTGARVFLTPPDRAGRVDVEKVLDILGGEGIQSLLVEGGAAVHGSFWDAGLVDEAFFFYAPLVIGGADAKPAIGGKGAESVSDSVRLSGTHYHKLGDNWLIQGLATDLNSFWRS